MKENIPLITIPQMKEIDRLMIEVFDISLEKMMEQAGKHLAYFCSEHLKKNGKNNVIIFVGSGNNGGGGLVAARYLSEEGYAVHIVLMKEAELMREVLKTQLVRVGNNENVIFGSWEDFQHLEIGNFGLAVDALLGYGMKGKLEGKYQEVVEQINLKSAYTVSLDIPSGLGNDFSEGDLAVDADATLTIALPKDVLQVSPSNVGDMYIIDIGIPDKLYDIMHIEVPVLFEDGPIVKAGMY